MENRRAECRMEKVFCMLESPRKEGQPFGIKVYSVEGKRPCCVLRAEGSRTYAEAFLEMIRKGGHPSEKAVRKESDPYKKAGV